MQDLKEKADNELVSAFQKTKNDVYFEDLFRRYQDIVYSKALSFTADPEAAKDLTQEIFIKVYLNLKNFRREAKFKTWLYRIVVNHCYNYLTRRKEHLPLEEEKETPKVSRQEDEQVKADRLGIQQALEKLDPKDRMVLLLKYTDGYPYKEIAKMLSISESAAKMRIKRAKKKFAEVYKNGG